MKRMIALSLITLVSIVCRTPAQAPPPPPVDAAAAPAAAQPKTIWSSLGISCDKIRECKEKLCNTPLGQMMNSMLAPIRLGTGGLIGNCCPDVPGKLELEKIAAGEVSPAEAAAAKIKMDEAQAKERRAAVRYLGTVDCHYYPEAEAALIAALRADRNECVRLEAARALGNGCCCTKNTIERLFLVISGSDKDGNPVETSERVKMCAMESLTKCMSRGIMAPPLVPPELPPPTPLPPEVPALYKPRPGPTLELLASKTPGKTVAPPAPSASEWAMRAFAETASTRPTRALPTGQRSLFHIFAFSSRSPAEPAETPSRTETTPPPAAPPALAPNAPRRVDLRPIGLAPIGVVPE